MHREWFEPALARELGQVAAPEELWERVRSGRKSFKKGVHRSVNAASVGACATVLGMAMLLVVLWKPAVQIRSRDAGEIRAWVRGQAGVDVPLRGSVPMMGARVANGVVEIDYKGGRLVVKKGESGGASHPGKRRSGFYLEQGRAYLHAGLRHSRRPSRSLRALPYWVIARSELY